MSTLIPSREYGDICRVALAESANTSPLLRFVGLSVVASHLVPTYKELLQESIEDVLYEDINDCRECFECNSNVILRLC